MSRSYNRTNSSTRPIKITTGVIEHAEGSVMIEFGKTRVICTASIEDNVAQWLKGKGQGWITAEYGMLPRSTHTRMKRERDKMSGRTHEIQRLIGRALRTCLDLKKIGERTVIVDCDVIQADGGTRTASITGGYVALSIAVKKLQEKLKLSESPLIDQVSAVSVGMKNGEILVDLDYDEDSTCDVDMNFVMTASGKFVEIQGTAEHKPFSRSEMDAMTEAAVISLKELQNIQAQTLK